MGEHALNTQSVTIFIVEDDARVRAPLEKILQRKHYRSLSFESAHQFLDYYQSDLPGCLLLDINMPDMNGLELQHELAKRNCTIPIVFITGCGDVSMTVQALKAGAVDFIEKPYRIDTLINSIDQALLKDQQTRATIEHINHYKKRFVSLTEREYEVLEILVSRAGNASSKDIARQLGISHRTVEQHRARIMEKTGCDSATELCLIADKVGLAEFRL